VVNFSPPLAREGQGGGINVRSPSGGGQGGGSDVTVIAVPVTDTCKEVVDGLVRRTIPRDTLVDARGPWTFQREALMQALDRVGSGVQVSNPVELCQAARLRVRVLIQR
jgi:2-C-methyl-D-erythritol 4-phosphate cytidylyltransferase